MTSVELLEGGGGRTRPRVPPPVVWVVTGALVALALVAVVRELEPWQAGPPTTAVELLVRDAAGVAWVGVDNGARREVGVPDGPFDGVATVVGAGVVVQERQPGPVADAVVGYGAGGSVHLVGEGDRVIPASASSVWLVVDGAGRDDGGAVLASAYGTWRSRVFPVPSRLQVVGAQGDTLLVLVGRYRSRELVLWTPPTAERLRSFGQVLAVQQVLGAHALVTTGCLSSGCTTATVSLTDGETIDLRAPQGWTLAGEPRLVDRTGRVAVVVADATGQTRLALGPPGSLQLTDAPTPDAGRAVLAAGGDWLVVPAAGGDAVLWRPGTSPEQQPRVELSADAEVLGATTVPQ